jgi:predicted secreted hydrolase
MRRHGAVVDDRLGRRTRWLAVVVAGALLVVGCTTPILANDPIVFPSPPAPSAAPPHAPDPIPISLPRDDGPHDRLTEWWYYTGHLQTQAGRRFGFEAVVFRAERGSVPAAWAAHLALTDEQAGAFHYAQRSEIGPEVDHSPRDASGAPTGFDLQVRGLSPTLVLAGAPPLATPWRLAGGNGTDHIEAALTPDEAAASGAAFTLRLDLRATKPPAFHDRDGFVEFGPAGGSYYYSRTRLSTTGTLELDGQRMPVDGIAWFDHQWGDFVSVGAGGWDWIAINLEDGTDITASTVLDAAGAPVVQYGTLVTASGEVRHLGGGQFTATDAGFHLSRSTGRLYPASWQVFVDDYEVNLTPTVLDQELDTRATTGVIYWEGSQNVRATKGGAPVGGEAYVEITRYGR